MTPTDTPRKTLKGTAYIYVLFLMSGIFSVIMVLLHITFLNAAIAANATAAANLHPMAQHGIYKGIATINENITNNAADIRATAIYNDGTLAEHAIAFVYLTTFTLQNGEYTIVVEISHNNHWDSLQIRSTATKQGIYSSVRLVAILDIQGEIYFNQFHYPIETYVITPLVAEIYIVFEEF
ncbi:MAG: hypothetical protein FWG63_05505 [Defluviitaleaceae bacterium]|nr:hypothetical protein [Defluviitaleaceae bacterium]